MKTLSPLAQSPQQSRLQSLQSLQPNLRENREHILYESLVERL